MDALSLALASAARRDGRTLASSALAFAAASAAACAPQGRQLIISALFLWTGGPICKIRRLLAIDIRAPSLPTHAFLPALCNCIIITAMLYLLLLCLFPCRRVFRCLLGRRLQSHSNRTCHRTVSVICIVHDIARTAARHLPPLAVRMRYDTQGSVSRWLTT